MRPTSKTLRFPLAGVVQKYPYSTSSSFSDRGNYGSPSAVNVRGVGVFESRLRGGSRPPLVIVPAVEGDATVKWRWPNGEVLSWKDDTPMTFDKAVEDKLTSSGARLVRRDIPISVRAEKGSVPEGFTISATYRDRLVLIKDNLWYMSRQGDYTDFDMGGDSEDLGRAVAGSVSLAAEVGEPITAVIPIKDDHIIFATANSLWVLRGAPTTGPMTRFSESIGIVSAWAWGRNEAEIAFLSNDGVYLMSGETLSRFSEERVPRALIDPDVDANTILMIYDVYARGYHLFITPDEITDEDSGVKSRPLGSHFWLDVSNRAVWPVVLNADYQPVSVAQIKSDKLEEVALLGSDGIWRKFDPHANKEDIEDWADGANSSVSFGPIQFAPEMQDAFLAEMYVSTAAGSDLVTVDISTGRNAEEAVAAIPNPSASFDFMPGWSHVVRPRVRGAWGVFTFKSSGMWAFETITILVKQLGRLR